MNNLPKVESGMAGRQTCNTGSHKSNALTPSAGVMYNKCAMNEINWVWA